MGVLERLTGAQGPEKEAQPQVQKAPGRVPRPTKAGIVGQRGEQLAEERERRSKTTVLERLQEARQPTATERLAQAGAMYGRSLAEIPASVMDSIATAGELVQHATGLEFGLKSETARARQYAQAIRDVAEWALPGAEQAADEFLASQLPAALGSGAGFVLGGGLLQSVGVPAAISTMGLGAAVQGAAQWHDAKMQGASDEDAFKAWALGLGVGTTEAVPIAGILNRANRASGGALRRVLVDAVVEGAEEATQETLSQAASNLIASHIVAYEPDRELLEGIVTGEAPAAGFLSGVFLSALASGAARSKYRQMQRLTDVETGEAVKGEAAPAQPLIPPPAEEDVAPGPEPKAEPVSPAARPEFEPVVAAKEGVSEDLKQRLRAGYKGPETVAAGERPAGFTDSAAEARRAQEIGLQVVPVDQKRTGKTWYVYASEEGAGAPAEELADFLEAKGYGETTEEKLELSRLAGYSEEQIEDFRRALEGEQEVEGEADALARAVEQETKQAERQPASAQDLAEMERQAEVRGMPESDVEVAREAMREGSATLDEVLEGWESLEPSPEPARVETEITRGIERVVERAREEGRQEGRQEERRKRQEPFEGPEKRAPAAEEERAKLQAEVEAIEKEEAAKRKPASAEQLAEMERQAELLGVPEDMVEIARTSMQEGTATLEDVLEHWTEPEGAPPEVGAETREAAERLVELGRREQRMASVRERVAEIDREMARLEALRRKAKLPATKEKHKAAQVKLHEERRALTEKPRAPDVPVAPPTEEEPRAFRRITTEAERTLPDVSKNVSALSERISLHRSSLDEVERRLRRTKQYGRPTKLRRELLNKREAHQREIEERQEELNKAREQQALVRLAREEEAVLAEADPLRRAARIFRMATIDLPVDTQAAVETRREAAWEQLEAEVRRRFEPDALAKEGPGSVRWYAERLFEVLSDSYHGHGAAEVRTYDKFKKGDRKGGPPIDKVFRVLSQAAKIEQRKAQAKKRLDVLEEHSRKLDWKGGARNIAINGIRDLRRLDVESADDLKEFEKRADALENQLGSALTTQEAAKRRAQYEKEVEPLLVLESFEEGSGKGYRFATAWGGNKAKGNEYVTDGRMLVKVSALREKVRDKWKKPDETGRVTIEPTSIQQVWEFDAKKATEGFLLGHVTNAEGDRFGIFRVGKKLRVLNFEFYRVLTQDTKADRWLFPESNAKPVGVFKGNEQVAVAMPMRVDDSPWFREAENALKAGRSFQEHAAELKTNAANELGVQVEEDGDIEDVEGNGPPLDPAELPAEMGAGFPVDPVAGGGANVGTPIGGRLLGRLETPPKPEKGEPVSAPQIIHALSKVVQAAGRDVPIRWGRLGRMKARGVFHVDPEVIRVKTANNVATAAHEVGHALEKAVFGWSRGGPWKKPTVARGLQTELVALGKALYGTSKPAAGYKREGFAEFIRLYTTAPELARDRAPQFHDWFENTFLVERCPKCKPAVDEVRALAGRWRNQGAQARAAASIVQPESRILGTLKAIRRFFTIQNLFEMAKPLHDYSRQAETRMGRILAPEEDPFFTLSALRTTHDARTAYMVENSMIDLAGNHVGPGLSEITGLVKGRYRDFSIYLWAQRAIALWTDPNRQARNPGLSLEDAQQIVVELDSPAFQLAADRVYAWNEGVLNYAAQASPSFAKVVARIREVDPGYYIPLQREFEELDSIWASRGGGGLGSEAGGIVKRLRGSGRRIKNPFPVMIANARKTVLQAHRRLVLDQVIRLSVVEGMGNVIREVPREMVPAASATIDDLINQINKRAIQATGEVFSLGKEGEGDLEPLAGEMLTFFAPAYQPKGRSDDPVIPVWDSDAGRIRWYEVDQKLLKTLASLDVYRLPKVLELLFAVPAQLFRAGTTGLRASFGLITNPTRDVQTFYLNTRTGAWAPRLFAEWVKQLSLGAVNRASGRKYTSPYLNAFLRLGGEMAQPLGQDIPHTERAARRLFQGPVARVFDPRNAFDFMRELLQFPEAAARVAELKITAKEIGWKPGQQMTLNQSLQLLLSAKQVTTDFTAAGEFSRVWNRIAPFHNASLQGPRANVRALRRNPGKFLFRGLQLGVATLLLWWWNRDEEWYKELSSDAKALFWHIPVRWQGRDELVRVPRAFEPGMAFGAAPELFADAWYRQDPEQAGAFFDKLFEVLVPNLEPVLLDEAFDQYANRDRFWDTPIVPMGQQRKPAEEQYNEYTSHVARFLGETFQVSPRRIDHAIRGVFGGVVPDVINTVGLGGKARERGDEAADTMILGRLFQRGGRLGYHPKSIDRLYDMLEEANLKQASDRHEETAEERQTRLMLTDATRALSALAYVRSQTDDVDKRRDLMREATSLAGDALQAAETGRAPRARFKALRKRAEAREEAVKR